MEFLQSMIYCNFVSAVIKNRFYFSSSIFLLSVDVVRRTNLKISSKFLNIRPETTFTNFNEEI